MSALTHSEPTDAMRVARLAMLDAVRPHADALGASGLLAVAAYLVGQLISQQDQRVMTPDLALQLVWANIEAGNQDAIQQFINAPGGHA